MAEGKCRQEAEMDQDDGSATVNGSTLAGAVTGFSCDVNRIRSSVAETMLVRQMKIVEITSAMVQATPPSIP